MKKILLDIYRKIIRASQHYHVKSNIKNGTLKVGPYTYGIGNLQIDNYAGSEAKVIIGKYCSLSKDIRLIPGGIHPTDWVSTFPFRAQWNLPGKFTDGMPYSKGNIVIGNDVWIGTGATILSGVSVGDGAIISASSIVTKDVAPYAIVGGNPARLIRFRFKESRIKELLEMCWWDWPETKIRDNIDFLNSK